MTSRTPPVPPSPRPTVWCSLFPTQRNDVIDFRRHLAGPPYFGRFGNGRIEGWCLNARPMKRIEMKDDKFMGKTAEEMAKLHSFVPPAELNPWHVDPGPGMWTQLWAWFKQAKAVGESCALFSASIDPRKNVWPKHRRSFRRCRLWRRRLVSILENHAMTITLAISCVRPAFPRAAFFGASTEEHVGHMSALAFRDMNSACLKTHSLEL